MRHLWDDPGVFDFGIDGYRPHWLNDRAAVLAGHGERLRALIGRPLTRTWLVWDVQDEVWFPDCPVLLDFAGVQVEVNHQKFDDLSISWNTIHPHRPVRWPDFDLRWRADPLPELRALRGRTLRDLELLAWAGDDLARGTLALSFRFPDARLTVVNALDENGLAFGPPDGRYHGHALR